MNDQSPPKRVTRARAAAKTTDTGVKTTKIATAASKAKVTRAASTTKRKTRADDVQEDEPQHIEEDTKEIIEPEPEVPKTTRGRPKKGTQAQPEAEMEKAPAPTRGSRATKKVPAVESEVDKDVAASEKPTTAPSRSTRAPKKAPTPNRLTETSSSKTNDTAVDSEVHEVVGHSFAASEEPVPAPTKTTRGRPKKAEPAASEPARTTRGRAKKVEVAEAEPSVVEEPAKKPTRTRAATVSKATAPKKSVKFEEPDKENIAPPAANGKGKAKDIEVGTGLKAKPVRKPAVTTRSTRGRANVDGNINPHETSLEPKVEERKSSPLSPKKATQVATAKDHSDDELATNEKTPMKPLMRSPMKPPGSVSVFGTAKKLDFSVSQVNRAITQDFGGSIMASPARRPPASAFKESLRTSPQRANLGDALGGSLLKSPFKMSMPAEKSSDEGSPFKASLLQSPARRPQSPTKVTEKGSPSRSGNDKSVFGTTPKASTFKISRFATPRTLTKSAMRPGQMLPPSTMPKVSSGSPNNDLTDLDEPSAPSLSFSGRLSSIMPREADPAIPSSEPISEENEAEPVIEPAEDPMVIDDTITVVGRPSMDVQSNTPIVSPSRNSTGDFGLREVDENPFHESDSEDELASGSPKYSPIALTGFNTSSHDFATSPNTPIRLTAITKTPKTTATMQKSARKQQIGFTPLAQQLSSWMSASPEKSTAEASRTKSNNVSSEQVAVQPSLVKSTYFDDEMSVRDEMQDDSEASVEVDDIHFSPVEVDEEDLALAHEADEMSLLEQDHLMDVEDVDQLMNAEPEQMQISEDMVAEFINTEAVQYEIAEVVEPADINSEQNIEEPLQQVIISDAENIDSLQPDAIEPSHMVEGAVWGLGITEPENIEAFQPDTIGLDSSMQEEADHLVPVEFNNNETLSPEVTVEPALSEASQDYGDENAMPLDPALFAIQAAPLAPAAPSTPRYSTPKRVLTERVFHTVSKVPLKAAAEDSPLGVSPVKRSASISKLPVQQPTTSLTRSNTVISYSPSKRTRSHSPQKEVVMRDACVTPSKPEGDGWSTIGTPARTPRRDLNTALLKGAVVFVDVHTTEGADASGLFTELLTQMGARCVKRWDWNGDREESSKIGITHVVFKDGGKRTLEKAKETDGVVSCVGVGWVLE
jgi:hypothetical protein